MTNIIHGLEKNTSELLSVEQLWYSIHELICLINLIDLNT